MVDYRENNKWTVYVHIVSKEICGYDHDKYYVGITSQEKINNRWRNGKGYKQCTYFNNAIKKYGWENIEHEIIARHLTHSEACQMEKTLIEKTKSNISKYGYNLSAGGEGVTGIKRFGKDNPFYGKKHSEYTKNLMKEHHPDISGINNPFYGLHHNDETKIILSNKKRQYYNDKEKIIGHKMSEEQKKNIGKYHSKPILQYDLEMNFIKEYDNLLSLEKLGYRRASIRDVCLGKRENYNNYIWRYKNNDDAWKEGYIVGTNSDNIYCMDKDFNLIGHYKSYLEASTDIPVGRRIISSACKGSNNHYALGYYWLYKEDYEKFSKGLLILER